ncbi:hypothetical protein, partial [Mycoplasmoides pneumoniae]
CNHPVRERDLNYQCLITSSFWWHETGAFFMEFSFSPKLFVVAVAAALPLMASAADTPSTATARKGFAGYDHPNQYPQNAAIYWICTIM